MRMKRLAFFWLDKWSQVRPKVEQKLRTGPDNDGYRDEGAQVTGKTIGFAVPWDQEAPYT